MLTERNADHERVFEFQLEAQRAFAKRHRWLFLYLTGPLRAEVK